MEDVKSHFLGAESQERFSPELVRDAWGDVNNIKMGLGAENINTSFNVH